MRVKNLIRALESIENKDRFIMIQNECELFDIFIDANNDDNDAPVVLDMVD